MKNSIADSDLNRIFDISITDLIPSGGIILPYDTRPRRKYWKYGSSEIIDAPGV
jgi:hypothetical protein